MIDRQNTILNVLAVVCVLFILATFYFNGNSKRAQAVFEIKKSEIVKESLGLKDKIESIQDSLDTKATEVASIELEKKVLSDKLENLKKESDRSITLFHDEINTLKKKNSDLRKQISEIEKSPILKRIKDYINREENDAVKKILEEAAVKMERIQAEREGRSVNLDPIVVEGESTEKIVTAVPPAAESPEVSEAVRKGAVLSVDRRNSLIVVNLGRKDNMKEGGRIKIFKKDFHIASAELINVRYRIAAAAVDDISYKNSINDIKEGDIVMSSDT